MSNVRYHIYIRGRVQGVFFRATTKEKASGFGIHGWVKNCADGRVEAVFEGESEAVEKMIDWCRKGPAGAFVEEVQIHKEDHTGAFDGFSIRF